MVYFYELKSGEFVQSKKMILSKEIETLINEE